MDVLRLAAERLARIGTAGMLALVAAAVRQREGCIAVADAAQQRGEVGQLLGDQMHDLAFPLDPPIHADQACRENKPALPLEHIGPDDDIGDPRLVLDGHEQDTLGGTGHLPDEDQAGGGQPTAVTGGAGFTARDDAPLGKLRAEKRERMPA